MKKVTMVVGDVWTGVYIDGALVCEAESISIEGFVELLRQNDITIGAEIETKYADEGWLLERRHLPEDIAEVLLDGMAEDKNSQPDWVLFTELAKTIPIPVRFVSRYVDGRHGFPELGKGLRFHGDPVDYNRLFIHKGDVKCFIERVKGHRWK